MEENKINDKKIFSLLGLATRSRKVISGEFMTEKAVKSGQAYLVIVSTEASDNTKKLFTNRCTHYNVPLRYFGTKNDLGHCMGKEMRTSLAVLEDGFAKSILKYLEGSVIIGQQNKEIENGENESS